MNFEKNGKTYTVRECKNAWSVSHKTKSGNVTINITFSLGKDNFKDFESVKKYVLETKEL